MTRLSFVHVEVLSNVDAEWRAAADVRGALRLTVPKVIGVLNSLRYRGLVASRRGEIVCASCGHGNVRVTWRITDAGRSALAAART